MRRWIWGIIGTVVLLGIFGYVLFTKILVVRAPRGGVVHIETPGGPVPIGVTFFDRDWAVLDVGNGDRATKEPLFSGREQDFLIRKFEWSSPSFVIEFPRDQTMLVMEPTAHERGEYKAEGKLIVRDGEKIIGEFNATMPRVLHQNWFDPSPVSDVDELLGDFDGRWVLEFPNKQETAMFDIIIYRKVMDNSPVPDANAVLLSFSTTHRNFAGRSTGNRIRLASFDNAYPALIDATIQDDGTLKGDLWVGDRLHESFTAKRQ